jgi:hypothetical protein
MAELPNCSGVGWLLGKNPDDIFRGVFLSGFWQGNEKDSKKNVDLFTKIFYIIKAFRPLTMKMLRITVLHGYYYSSSIL